MHHRGETPRVAVANVMQATIARYSRIASVYLFHTVTRGQRRVVPLHVRLVFEASLESERRADLSRCTAIRDSDPSTANNSYDYREKSYVVGQRTPLNRRVGLPGSLSAIPTTASVNSLAGSLRPRKNSGNRAAMCINYGAVSAIGNTFACSERWRTPVGSRWTFGGRQSTFGF